jgi:hypothetical protein
MGNYLSRDAVVGRHRLPEDPPETGDASWFERLNAFEQQETRRQVAFKRKHWPCLPDGEWSGKPGYFYPHILPAGQEAGNLHPPIADAVAQYAACNDVVLHRESANLRSSQACCFNFLFPFREALGQAAAATRPLIPAGSEVSAIEFEYTGPGATAKWLGEPPGGKRGSNRTSSDAAIWWTDSQGCPRLTLVEWKYTERQFGSCGGFASKGNRITDRCLKWSRASFEPRKDCYLELGDTPRNSRLYWEHLSEARIDLDPYPAGPCPFIGPTYQLMRLHLLAAHLRELGEAEHTEVAVVCFKGNTDLLGVPPHLSQLGPDIPSAWRRLLREPGSFRICYAEDLAAAIRSAEGNDSLAAYLNERHGV